MFEKLEILIFIFILLLAFYFVISISAKGFKKATVSPEIKRYLFGVRVLILILAIVSLILWILS